MTALLQETNNLETKGSSISPQISAPTFQSMGSPVQPQYYQPRPEDYERTVFTDDRMQLNRQQLNNFVSPSDFILKS